MSSSSGQRKLFSYILDFEYWSGSILLRLSAQEWVLESNDGLSIVSCHFGCSWKRGMFEDAIFNGNV